MRFTTYQSSLVSPFRQEMTHSNSHPPQTFFFLSSARNIAVGNLSVRNILLTRHLWVQIAPSIPSLLQGGGGTMASPQVTPKVKAASRTFPPRTDGEEIPKTMRRWQRQQQRQRQRQHLQRSRRLANNPRHPPGEDLPLTYRWVKGFVTNLEYLLAVNAAAGRLPGDRSCHPIVPWVSDLSQPVGEGVCVDGSGKGWRDLTMTKFRLKKGDEQVQLVFFFYADIVSVAVFLFFSVRKLLNSDSSVFFYNI